jgi:hypothetical protein
MCKVCTWNESGCLAKEGYTIEFLSRLHKYAALRFTMTPIRDRIFHWAVWSFELEQISINGASH